MGSTRFISYITECYNLFFVCISLRLPCSLVRERTAQLRVMMDTIETLQQDGGDSSSSAQSALVTRVVELTAELSSQNASVALAERKVLELESDRIKKGKLCNSLKSQVQNSSRAIEELQSQYKVAQLFHFQNLINHKERVMPRFALDSRGTINGNRESAKRRTNGKQTRKRRNRSLFEGVGSAGAVA